MRSLSQADASEFAGVKFVLTDMDDTLTFGGRLAARTYAALEQLQGAGIKVIPVTAAPSGWCDQMVRMWPVDAVIGENGALHMLRREGGVARSFWTGEAAVETNMQRLMALRDLAIAKLPDVRVAADQPFRLASLAFDLPASREKIGALIELLRANGAQVTVNSLWVLAWIGQCDKLKMTRRLMRDVFDLDIDTASDSVVYVGDSANDAPMFGHFPKSAGVSTVVDHVHAIDHPPAWVTVGPGGEGFVEVAEAVLSARGLIDRIDE
jgi:HAD superfamily hydrolase (TIGR01484 family)